MVTAHLHYWNAWASAKLCQQCGCLVRAHAATIKAPQYRCIVGCRAAHTNLIRCQNKDQNQTNYLNWVQKVSLQVLKVRFAPFALVIQLSLSWNFTASDANQLTLMCPHNKDGLCVGGVQISGLPTLNGWPLLMWRNWCPLCAIGMTQRPVSVVFSRSKLHDIWHASHLVDLSSLLLEVLLPVC